MARKKRRRPNAGPPPVRTPRQGEVAAQAPPAARRPARGRDEMPQPMSLRAIGLRAIVAAVIFFVYVMVVGGAGPDEAFPFAAFAFVLMLPLGFVMDRAVLRLRMKRWHRAHPPKPGPRKPE